MLESYGHVDTTLDLGGRDTSGEIVKIVGSLLLKLESIYNVSGKCVDDLVEQLQLSAHHPLSIFQS